MLDIKFPIYPLRQHEKLKQSKTGVVLVINPFGTTYVLDDKSLKGNFGRRRLSLKYSLKKGKDFKLYPLGKSLKGWPELAKNVRKNHIRVYIDHTGHVFKYKPDKYYPLIYHKILKRVNVEGKGWFIEVSNINTPLKLSYIPTLDMAYAGVLKLPIGNIVYELAQKKKSDTRRKL